MANILFTGAGFTRNWDGWLADEVFEYLLGDPSVTPSSWQLNRFSETYIELVQHGRVAGE